MGIIVKSLDGRESTLKLNDSNVESRSSLHQKAILLIRDKYPYIPISEEVPVRINICKTLYLDIFIAKFNTAIEIHGEQHFKFIPYFHTTKYHFYRCQNNDRVKKQWCQLNNIQLIELLYDESIEQWKEKLRRIN